MGELSDRDSRPAGPSRRAFLAGAASLAAAAAWPAAPRASSGAERARAESAAATDLLRPHGVAVTPDGTVFVVDSGHYRIVVCSPDLHPVRSFGRPGFGPGLLNFPTGLALAPDGTLFVADSNNGRICRFDAGGAFLGELGSLGGSPGLFFSPQGVRVGADGVAYVANTRGHNVQVVEPGGRVRAVWGMFGDDEAPVTAGDLLYRFRLPTDVALLADGRALILDSKHGRVVAIRSDGRFDSEFGQPGSGDGELSRPQALAVAADSIFVCDTGNGRVVKFDLAGRYRGARGGFVAPAGIAVDAARARLLVADAEAGVLRALEIF